MGARITEAEFVARLTDTHEGRIGYLFGYSIMHKKAHFICFDCSHDWWALAHNLVKKDKPRGCPTCAQKSRVLSQTKTTEQYIEDLRSVHGDRYRLVGDYINNRTKTLHHCNQCNETWDALPDNLLKGAGCPTCGDKSRALSKTKTTGQYIEDLRSVHGDKYHLVGDYLGIQTKTPHLCGQCDKTWDVMPNNLLDGKGCPNCANTGFDPSKPAICYYLRVSSPVFGELYKIGITNLSVKKRFTNDDLQKINTVKTWEFDVGGDARDMEREILAQHSDDRYTGEPVLANGNTELFTRDILKLDHNLLCP